MFYSPSTNAFYPESLRGDYERQGSWSPDAVEVPKEDYQTFGAGNPPAGLQRGAGPDGRPTWIAIPVPALAALIARKLAEINARYEAEIAAISAGYPPSEIESWYKQEAQARAFLADPNAITVWLDSAATARGIDKTEFATRIVAKADLFEGVSGQLTGKRQALEDAINALPADATAADLDAIQW